MPNSAFRFVFSDLPLWLPGPHESCPWPPCERRSVKVPFFPHTGATQSCCIRTKPAAQPQGKSLTHWLTVGSPLKSQEDLFYFIYRKRKSWRGNRNLKWEFNTSNRSNSNFSAVFENHVLATRFWRVEKPF